jgi:Transglutaminase-like superfamily
VRRAVPSSAKKSQQRAWGVSAKRIAQLEIAAAHNLFFRTNCLERSLVLWSLLRRHGFLAELKFGARKEDGKFEAHAWVELDGRALNNDAEAHHGFVPFDSTVTSVGTQSE